MNEMMAVLLNGIAQIEYDRSKKLADHQAAYLDKMDHSMDKGIEADGSLVEHPDQMERARFVAGNLAHAIKTDNEELAAAMTTYLAVRVTDLKQVKIDEQDGEFTIDLVFNEAYVKQHPVSFGPLQ